MNDELQELVRTPQEDLQVELKQWMDMTDKNVHAKLAKELIALRNHGGGYLAIGFKDGNPALPDPVRPENLEGYSTDVFNNILKRYAEPTFHCMSYAVPHPETGETYPVIAVPGGAKVPVRCKADSPDGKSIKVDTYYIRRPGPESCPIQTGADWDALIQNCILNRKEELLSALSGILNSGSIASLPGASNQTPIDVFAELKTFRDSSVAELEVLQNELPTGAGARLEHGRYVLSGRLLGNLKQVSPIEMLEILRFLPKHTGWPPLHVFSKNELAPYPSGNSIECWLGREKSEDAGHADFWRVSLDGKVVLVRGYQEDGPDFASNGSEVKSKLLELTVPAWRVGEFLLRMQAIGSQIAVGNFEIQLVAEWEGLKGRRLTSHGGRRLISDNFVATDDKYVGELIALPDGLDAALPGLVAKIVTPLLQRFSFFEPPAGFFEQEISKMLRREYS